MITIIKTITLVAPILIYSKGGSIYENFKKPEEKKVILTLIIYQYGETFALWNRMFNLMTITNDLNPLSVNPTK